MARDAQGEALSADVGQLGGRERDPGREEKEWRTVMYVLSRLSVSEGRAVMGSLSATSSTRRMAKAATSRTRASSASPASRAAA